MLKRLTIFAGVMMVLTACPGPGPCSNAADPMCVQTDGGPMGGGSPTGTTLEVSSDITANTTWSPTAADCDVLITKDGIDVTAALTILPGVKVCFAANTSLVIKSVGSLSAVGTAANRIIFTGVSQTKGFWKGVQVLSNNVANKIHYVDVEYAGADAPICCASFWKSGDAKAGIVVGDNATAALVSIQHTSVSNSGHDGLDVFAASKLTGFGENTFFSNQSYAASMYFSAVSDLDSASVFSGGTRPNGEPHLRIFDNNEALMTPVVVHKIDVPYGMGETATLIDFKIKSTLTIEAGVEMRFESNSSIKIETTGKLAINGTDASKVILTGKSATPGFWKGIAVTSLANTISNTELTYAGATDEICCGFSGARAALVVGEASGGTGGLTITNVKTTKSANRGVYVLKGTLTQAGTNDLETDNALPSKLIQ
jgi:hypothetical protein